MALRIRRPSPADLARLLADCRAADLTYEPTGISVGGSAPAGFRRHRWSTSLAGEDALARARTALEEWAVHRGSGLLVESDGPLVVGTNVAMAAPLPVGWIDVTCRVVAVIDEPDRFGFAYGTLPIHPEIGEESFVARRDPSTGSVSFDVEAVSRPGHLLARLAGPIADRMQDQAAQRYLAAMSAAVASG